jgi:hypothetical protein
MARVARQTKLALSAAGVDLSDNALAQKVLCAGRALYDTDELVADCSFKARVPAHNLHIRITDARQRDAHYGFLFIQRLRNFGNRKLPVLVSQGFHKIY